MPTALSELNSPSLASKDPDEDQAVARLVAAGVLLPPSPPRRISYAGWRPPPGRGPSIIEDVEAIRGAP